jgi:hypothetical protein
MTGTLTRPASWLLSLTATTALTLSVASPATAAAPPAGPRVTLAEARAALPAPAELPPGNVTGFNPHTIAKPTGLSPCNLAAKSLRLNLHDNGAAVAMYGTPASAPVKDLAQWVVAARVFASAQAAHTSISRLGAVERRCPSVAKVKSAAGTMTFTRTWSSRYVTAGWHGYHTVDVITIAGRPTRLRHIAVYLQRGNALIQVDEIATVVGHNSAQQENRRLSVQNALAARVEAAAAT